MVESYIKLKVSQYIICWKLFTRFPQAVRRIGAKTPGSFCGLSRLEQGQSLRTKMDAVGQNPQESRVYAGDKHFCIAGLNPV
jgi:hypothetical protein